MLAVSSLVRVDPDDAEAVQVVVEILDAAHAVDDPAAYPEIAEEYAAWLRWGWDLEPSECYLYAPVGEPRPVAVLTVHVPQRDNRHLLEAQVTVHPAHRRRGHGTVLMRAALDQADALGRDTVWTSAPEADGGARAFVERLGFAYASHDARRRQVLAEVDPQEVARLHAAALAASAGYELVRLTAPVPDEVLEQLAEVTAAINDAPMGALTFEDERFDAARLRDLETAIAGRGGTLYRIAARHRATGDLAGHTFVMTSPHRPELASQGDTAVARGHRGHRLGLLLKIDMMRWLAEVEPQVEVVETWNHADNTHMIAVNEALGYRLSLLEATYERRAPGR